MPFVYRLQKILDFRIRKKEEQLLVVQKAQQEVYLAKQRIRENEEDDYVEIAEPVGIIAGVTPVTNPTSTTMFKSIISAKTRNVIIFGFHPSAQKCSTEAATVMRDAAIKAGANAYPFAVIVKSNGSN